MVVFSERYFITPKVAEIEINISLIKGQKIQVGISIAITFVKQDVTMSFSLQPKGTSACIARIRNMYITL